MTPRRPAFLVAARALVITSLVLASVRMSAAQTLGAGPLTETLTNAEPTSAVFNWGRVKFAPGLEITEFGHNSNVFDEYLDPKSDWVFRATPDVSMFAALRFFKFTLYAGSQLGYYKTYTGENSAGYEYRGRLDVLASRFQPFIGGGETSARTRPNGEIDTRADQKERELSGGLVVALGPQSRVYVAASSSSSEFSNAFEDGVDLATSLNQDVMNYSAGLQTGLTPLTTLTVFGSFQEDRFRSVPQRDADTRSVTASVLLVDAVVSGTIGVSFVDFKPVDPLVEPFRGVKIEAAAIYPFMEIGRLSFSLIRGIEYSYDETEGYYRELSAALSYTHFLFGDLDFQVRGSKSWFDYGFREGSVPRTDTSDAVAAGVGYNLPNRTRIAVNYELAKRRSPAYVERNYDRTRIYMSWAYAF